MKKITNLKMIIGVDSAERVGEETLFEKEVKEHLFEGWELMGSPIFIPLMRQISPTNPKEYFEGRGFAQAVVRYTQE